MEVKTEPIVEDVKTSHKGNIYRSWNSNSIPAPLTKHKKSTDKELMEVCLFYFNTLITFSGVDPEIHFWVGPTAQIFR